MSKRRLLALDDEVEILKVVERVAEKLDFHVQKSSTWKDFEKIYFSFNPDVVVLDLIMPERDGTEVAKWLAKQGFKGQLIVISGYNPLYGKMLRVMCENDGMTNVQQMSKPLDLDKFRHLLLEAA